MPSQERVRSHNRGDLGQHLPSQSFGLRCQSSSLVIVEAKPTASELFPKDPVFFAKVVRFSAAPPSCVQGKFAVPKNGLVRTIAVPPQTASLLADWMEKAVEPNPEVLFVKQHALLALEETDARWVGIWFAFGSFAVWQSRDALVRRYAPANPPQRSIYWKIYLLGSYLLPIPVAIWFALNSNLSHIDALIEELVDCVRT